MQKKKQFEQNINSQTILDKYLQNMSKIAALFVLTFSSRWIFLRVCLFFFFGCLSLSVQFLLITSHFCGSYRSLSGYWKWFVVHFLFRTRLYESVLVHNVSELYLMNLTLAKRSGRIGRRWDDSFYRFHSLTAIFISFWWRLRELTNKNENEHELGIEKDRERGR